MEHLDSEGNPIVESVSACGKYPEHWDDDTRMNVLLNTFRDREVNPIGYDRKMEYWKKNVKLYCKSNNRCSFSIAQLKKFFTRNGRQPYCFETVLIDMKKDKTIIEIKDFMSSQSEERLFSTLLKSPMQWCYKMVTNIIVTAPEIVIDDDLEFIHIALLEKKAEFLMKTIEPENQKNKLFTFKELNDLTKMKLCTVRWSVHLLELQNKARTIERGNIKYTAVKISRDNEPVTAITDKELTLESLGEKIRYLKRNLEELENQKELAYEEVKLYLKKGMKQLARSSLRNEKEIEKQINKKISILDNLRSMEINLKSSEDDAHVLGAYKMAVDVLKKNTEEHGLDLDNVDDTMDNVMETLETYFDVQKTLGKQIIADDEDLENELTELLVDDAPSIPPTSPSHTAGNPYVDDLPELPHTILTPEKSNYKFKNRL